MNKKRSKRAQFYILAAVIIIFVIIWFASITNYVAYKKEPEKFYDLGKTLKIEGVEVINNLNFENPGSIDENIALYLDLFADYTNQHLEEDFNLIILYGDVDQDSNISARVYSRGSNGGVVFYLGQETIFTEDIVGLNKTEVSLSVNQDNTVDVTLLGPDGQIRTETVPILNDNNFIFVMTTSDGFNQYVQTNLNSEIMV